MSNTAEVTQRESTIAKYLPDWQKETVETMKPIWKQEFFDDCMGQVAKNLAAMGVGEKLIVKATGLDVKKVRHVLKLEFFDECMSQVAKNLASMGMEEEQIAKATGLDVEKVRYILRQS